MLLAHPAVLHDLVERYTALERAVTSGSADPVTRQRLADTAYTLCVSTGTRDIDAALIAARHRLPGARVEDDSVLSPRTPVRAGARTDGPAPVPVN
ncbi:DUF5133 domain-containing protein [Streptomyces cinnamoneus]|uniref:DUF5133 domain-containing protein n=1 Tax=Streptomyces cinnamoneus TaxID=53446 RepID=A0A2G1XNN6_STRCJ|nr:DUF5133 domain-containing protein [Streptomyces cinnamoneus]PHQ52830.1 DUF5133 domain-containing protein [Streptomyces cinnamoneus]PPT16305.1 DUF5133 domain-containing protein [Streptomyces cinnamoneus]